MHPDRDDLTSNLYIATSSLPEATPQATPAHLRLLEVAWKVLRKDRMQASLRRRATQSAETTTPGAEQVASTRSGDEQEIRPVANRRNTGWQHGDRFTLEKSIGRRAEDSGFDASEAAKRAAIESMRKLPLRSSHPARALDKQTALRPKPEKDTHKRLDNCGTTIADASQTLSRQLLPIRIGVLPPGRYVAPKAGYTLVVVSQERLTDLADHSEISISPMALVGKGLRAEVSPTGLCCVVFHTTDSGKERRRALLLEEQKSWNVKDIRLWKRVYTAVKTVQAATDRVSERSSQGLEAMVLGNFTKLFTFSQAVYNLGAGRLHISCNSPPEIIFYTNAFAKTSLHLPSAPIKGTGQRWIDDANDKACMLSKLVLNLRSGSCTIVCVSESRGSCYKSRRTLRTATLVDLTNVYTAEMRNTGKSHSTWSEKEIRCLGNFLDVRRYWEQYWATTQNQDRKL